MDFLVELVEPSLNGHHLPLFTTNQENSGIPIRKIKKMHEHKKLNLPGYFSQVDCTESLLQMWLNKSPQFIQLFFAGCNGNGNLIYKESEC